MAKYLGYKSRSTINKIELGKNDLTQSNIMGFAKLFHIEPGELLTNNPLDMKKIKQNWVIVDREETHLKEDKLKEMIQDLYGENAVNLLSIFAGLNEIGQKKALSALEDISELPKYRKDVIT